MRYTLFIPAITVLIALYTSKTYSQVGISINGATPDSSAILDVSSTTFPYQGMLMPRLTSAQVNSIIQPAEGLIVFNSDCGNFNYYDGSAWRPLNNGNNNLPAAAGTISGTANACQNQSGVAYSVPAISNASDYTWSYSGAGFSIASGSSTNSITADFSPTATSGNLTVYGSNNCGSGTVSANFSITITQSVSGVTASASPGLVCEGSTLSLSGSASNASSWSWTGPNSFTSDQQNPSISSITTAGAGTYSLTASNSCGAAAPANTNSVTVKPLPASAPTAGTHVPSSDQIVWNWNTVTYATGYKYNTTRDSLTATDNFASTTYTQTGLSCGASRTLYVWAYDSCGYSTAATLTSSTTQCTPGTISGLYLWYDADDASTFTYSSGSSVSQWADKSGNNFHATQGTVSYQPVRVTNEINGRAVVRFTASNGSVLVNNGFTINLASRTMFVVVKETGSFCYSGIISMRGSSPDYLASDGYIFGNACSGSYYNMINNRTYYNITPGPTGGPGSQQLPLGIYTEIVGSGTGTAYFNGVPFGTTGNSSNSTTSLGGLAMGRRYDTGSPGVLNSNGELNGDIAEVLMYNRPLNASERAQVGAYLSAKYNIPFTP